MVVAERFHTLFTAYSGFFEDLDAAREPAPDAAAEPAPAQVAKSESAIVVVPPSSLAAPSVRQDPLGAATRASSATALPREAVVLTRTEFGVLCALAGAGVALLLVRLRR